MKKLLPLLLLAAATASCIRRPVISGRIEGLTNDTLIVVSCKIADMPDLSDDLDSRIRYDTILARQGRLTFDIPVEVPTQFIISPAQLLETFHGRRCFTRTSDIRLFLDKGEHVVLKGRIDSSVFNCTIEGTRLNRELSRNKQQDLPLSVEMDRLQNSMEGKPRAEHERIFREFEQIAERQRLRRTEYAMANPNSPIAAYYLTYAPFDSLEHYYAKLGEKARNSIFKPLIDHQRLQRLGMGGVVEHPVFLALEMAVQAGPDGLGLGRPGITAHQIVQADVVKVRNSDQRGSGDGNLAELIFGIGRLPDPEFRRQGLLLEIMVLPQISQTCEHEISPPFIPYNTPNTTVQKSRIRTKDLRRLPP